MPKIAEKKEKEFKINIKNLKVNDVLSETSHYTVKELRGSAIVLFHSETKTDVTIASGYIQDILQSADQFTETIVVGKEDKIWTEKQIGDAGYVIGYEGSPHVGDLRLKGIRTLFMEIYDSQVFTACYTKADKPLSKKAYTEKLNNAVKESVKIIEDVKNNKKGVAGAAAAELIKAFQNPVLDYEPGEDRILRGYKIQFTSRDGRYDCIDMDIDSEKESPIRPVNINTLKWLIYKGVKYIVE
jgi:hypothetical protein